MIGVREALAPFPNLYVANPSRRARIRRSRHWLIAGLCALDTLALALAMSLAGVLRVSLDGLLPLTNLATERHVLVSLLLIPVLLLLFAWQGMYDFDQILA